MPPEADLPFPPAIDHNAFRRKAEYLRREAIDKALDRALLALRSWWCRDPATTALPPSTVRRNPLAMPLLTLITHPIVQDPGVRHAVARELSDHSARLLGKRLQVTAVAWLAAPLAWYVGGEPVSDAKQTPSSAQARTFSLDIRITAGTNTEAEKSAWIAAAWDTLTRALPGPVEPASYVCVTELPATDWGYGGRTQAARKATPLPEAPQRHDAEDLTNQV